LDTIITPISHIYISRCIYCNMSIFIQSIMTPPLPHKNITFCRIRINTSPNNYTPGLPRLSTLISKSPCRRKSMRPLGPNRNISRIKRTIIGHHIMNNSIIILPEKGIAGRYGNIYGIKSCSRYGHSQMGSNRNILILYYGYSCYSVR